MALNFFWIILSYLVGSIPFGYLISRAYNKNILETGWRKTSGSNVFKNVGKWQGAATGILDGLKAYLIVSLAKELGFSLSFQILSGIAVLVGNNWSIFLKFAGGRGIAVFIGAGLAFFPKTLLISLAPALLLALVWDASIATILLLVLIIVLSLHFNQFESAGVFTIVSLFPIFIKRLSPIKELSLKNKKVAISRFILDGDELRVGLRIKRIIRRLTENRNQLK